jgi:hypothetical protein
MSRFDTLPGMAVRELLEKREDLNIRSVKGNVITIETSDAEIKIYKVSWMNMGDKSIGGKALKPHFRVDGNFHLPLHGTSIVAGFIADIVLTVENGKIKGRPEVTLEDMGNDEASIDIYNLVTDHLGRTEGIAFFQALLDKYGSKTEEEESIGEEAKDLRVKTRIPDSELSDKQLAERIKSYKVDKSKAWSLFIAARGLRPGIDAKEFYALFDSATADPWTREITVKFEPTHRSKKDDSLTVMVTEYTPTVVRFIMSHGGTGSEPAGMFDSNWEPVKRNESVEAVGVVSEVTTDEVKSPDPSFDQWVNTNREMIADLDSLCDMGSEVKGAVEPETLAGILAAMEKIPGSKFWSGSKVSASDLPGAKALQSLMQSIKLWLAKNGVKP